MTKQKRNSIIYWIATIWLVFGMTTSGIVQLLQLEFEVEFFALLGYPVYLLTILGVWKLLGVVAILAPKYPLLKEWAYAGFFFTMTGAIFSHLSVGDPIGTVFPAVLMTALTVVSWYFRPTDRRII